MKAHFRFLILLVMGLYSAHLIAHSDTLSPAAEKKWHTKELLADTHTYAYIKDIYLNKHWRYPGGDTLFQLLGKIGYLHGRNAGFYFMVIAKSYDLSDGFYGEGLGYSGKEYIDKNLKYFLNYFIGKAKLPDFYLEKWSEILWLELSINIESNPVILQETISDYNNKCASCSDE